MIALNIPVDVAHRLRDRILSLIANHPEILGIKKEMLTTRILLEFPEFDVRDLNPTFKKMCWAFHSAVEIAKTQQDLEQP